MRIDEALQSLRKGFALVDGPLAITFELLSSTKNAAAVRLLIAALDSADPTVRAAAARTLIARPEPAAHLEVLRRWQGWADGFRTALFDGRSRMLPSLREAVLGADQGLAANACAAALALREYDLIPALIVALEDRNNPDPGLALNAMRELAGLLYEELARPRDYTVRRDPHRARRHATQALEESVVRFDAHRRLEVVEAFLLLTSRDNATLVSLLCDPRHAAHGPVVELLSRDSHGGVIRLGLSFLDDPHAPLAALQAIGRRGDRRFIDHLLHKFAAAHSAVAIQNLRRLHAIGWLERRLPLWADLDGEAQAAAVRLAAASGIPRNQVFEIVAWMLEQGRDEGRRAACEALAEFTGPRADGLALAALDDPDPLVQAAAARQLRSRGIPDSLPLLIELSESPHADVREAVRESLGEFTFARYVAAFDTLDDEARRTTGRLVLRLDVQARSLLADEVGSAARAHRLRGLEIVYALDLAHDFEEELLAAMYDKDHRVRAEAARALGRCDSPVARAALATAADEASLIVREAARDALSAFDSRADHAAPALATSRGGPA